MKRCTTPLAAALALGCAALLPLTAGAQFTPSTAAGTRNFPGAALRGTLALGEQGQAWINGQPVRLAPGLRIFSRENTLVFAHTLIGHKRWVNYLIEPSTGMLHTVWLLTDAEAAQPRPGSNAVDTNIRSEWDGKSSRLEGAR